MKLRQKVNGQPITTTWQTSDTNTQFLSVRENEGTATGAPDDLQDKGEMRHADIEEVENGVYSVLVENRSYHVRLEHTHYGTFAQVGPWRVQLETDAGRSSTGSPAGGGSSKVLSAMPGRVVRVLVNEGDTVEAGTGLLVLEAMKMQNEIVAPKAGVVRGLSVLEGAIVAAGALLCRVE